MVKHSTFLGAFILALFLWGSANAASSTQSNSARTRSNDTAVSGDTGGSSNPNLISSNETGTVLSNGKYSEQKCLTVQNRITGKINGYNKTNNRNLYAFYNMQARLKKVESRLRLEEGLDTSRLAADMTQLDKLIEKYSVDYGKLNNELKLSRTKACDDTQVAFKSKIDQMRAQVVLVHNDRDAIKEFYANKIKPDLIALKNLVDVADSNEEEVANQESTGTVNN